MRYLIRRFLNKMTRGRWVKIRNFISPFVNDNVKYYINSEIGQKLYYDGKFEEKELKLCRQFIKKDSIVMDIGANIGLHSIYFSKIATHGLILSIEPQTDVFQLLLINTSLYKNIIPLNIAIDNDIKISPLFITDDNAYSSLKDTKRKKIIDTKQVVTLPLDNFINLVNKVDFVKIDVEGFEMNVILSMQKILKTFKPTLFVEIYKGVNSNMDPEGTIKLLTDIGYKVFVVNNQGSLENFIKHNDSRYNYFFIA